MQTETFYRIRQKSTGLYTNGYGWFNTKMIWGREELNRHLLNYSHNGHYKCSAFGGFDTSFIPWSDIEIVTLKMCQEDAFDAEEYVKQLATTEKLLRVKNNVESKRKEYDKA